MGQTGVGRWCCRRGRTIAAWAVRTPPSSGPRICCGERPNGSSIARNPKCSRSSATKWPAGGPPAAEVTPPCERRQSSFSPGWLGYEDKRTLVFVNCHSSVESENANKSEVSGTATAHWDSEVVKQELAGRSPVTWIEGYSFCTIRSRCPGVHGRLSRHCRANPYVLDLIRIGRCHIVGTEPQHNGFVQWINSKFPPKPV